MISLGLSFDAAAALAPWSQSVAHPFKIKQHLAITGADGRIYLIGGLDESSDTLASARVFDPIAGTYTALPDDPVESRKPCGALLLDGRILVAGGSTFAGVQVFQIRIYDPTTNAWTISKAGSSNGSGCAATRAPSGKVHILGGTFNSSIFHDIYDPALDDGSTGPLLPRQRFNHGAATGSDGGVYVFGGHKSPTSSDIFDPATNTWTAGPDLPGPIHDFAYVGDGDHFWVIGGSNNMADSNPPYLDTVWVYDVAGATWSVEAFPLFQATRESAGAIDGAGAFHVFGGFKDGEKLDTHQTTKLGPDGDADGYVDAHDNCPDDPNAGQGDGDGDGDGDVCDECPLDPDNDGDGDGLCGDVDNCPSAANLDQGDGDADDLGDACDLCPADADDDIDGDTICGDVDNCPGASNTDQSDADADGIGDPCDPCPVGDDDLDGVCGDVDNCPDVANPDQGDGDSDGLGDACDAGATTEPPGDTTGSETTGHEAGETGADTPTGAPTTGGPGEGITSDPATDSAGATAGETTAGDTTAGGAVDGGGCGCRSPGAPPSGVLAVFALFGALRRRPCSAAARRPARP